MLTAAAIATPLAGTRNPSRRRRSTTALAATIASPACARSRSRRRPKPGPGRESGSPRAADRKGGEPKAVAVAEGASPNKAGGGGRSLGAACGLSKSPGTEKPVATEPVPVLASVAPVEPASEFGSGPAPPDTPPPPLPPPLPPEPEQEPPPPPSPEERPKREGRRRSSKWDEGSAPAAPQVTAVPDWLRDMAEPAVPTPSKPPVSVRVLRMQSVQIRVLLGRAGGTIREIIARTGADIKIDHSKRDDPEGDVTIIGNVNKTEAVIRELLASKGCPLRPPEGPDPKVPAEEDDLVVAPELVGLFIGKGGENIKDMREQVGGTIFIGVQPSTGPGIPQRIQVVGDNRERAKEVVREKLAEINAFAARLRGKAKGKGKLSGKHGSKGQGARKGMKGKCGSFMDAMMGAMMDMSCWDVLGLCWGWDVTAYDPSWEAGWGAAGDAMGWGAWGVGGDPTAWNVPSWNGMDGGAAGWRSTQGGGGAAAALADGRLPWLSLPW